MLAFIINISALAHGATASPSEIAPAPRPVEMRRADVPRSIEYFGTVVAVSSKSITVRGTANGSPKDEVVIRHFRAGKALAEGKEEWAERGVGNYRLTDVQVGDRVYLRLHHEGEDDLCAAVKIERRPGGLVPPAPWDDPDTKDPYHVRMRAWQAFEEKGIPLPPQLDPVWQNAIIDESFRQSQKDVEALIAKSKREDEGAIRRLRVPVAPLPRPVQGR